MTPARRAADLHAALAARLGRAADDWLLGAAARAAFATVLLVHFWNAALRKVEPGFPTVLALRDGAYAQIVPGALEAAGYDVGALGPLHHAVVLAGTAAEFALPALIVAGLLTRLAAAGMIVFVAVMSWVDVAAHGVGAAALGAWFDAQAGSAILDQRTLWAFLLLVLVAKGPGALSLDRLLGRLLGPSNVGGSRTSG